MVPGQAQSGWKAVIGYVCSLEVTSLSSFFSAELRIESWGYAHWANTEPHLQPISWSFVEFLQSMHSGMLPALRLTPQTLAPPGRLQAYGNTCVRESACHTFLWGRLMEIRTMTPSLTHKQNLVHRQRPCQRPSPRFSGCLQSLL